MSAELDPNLRSSTRGEREPSTIAGGSALLLSGQLVANAGFFVAVLLIARGLGPAGRGTIAFITVTALVVGRATKVGVTEATTVFAAQRADQRPALLSNLVLFTFMGGLSGAVVVCGLLFLLGGARPAGVGEIELLILALGVLANGLVVSGNAFLLGCARIRQRALLTAAAPWIYALLVALAWEGLGLTVARAAGAWVTSEGIWALSLFVVSVRGIGLARPSWQLLRESVSFGVRAWVGSLSTFANARADQILIGFIASEATLGIYAIAVNGAEILLYFPQATATALLPAIARGDPGRRSEHTLRVFRTVMLLTALGVLTGALVGAPLLPLLFGSAFQSSVLPFLLLLPGALGFTASIVFSNALVASSSPGASSLGPLVSLALGLLLDIALIPSFGATGAAVASTVAFLAGGITALVAYRVQTGFSWRAVVPGREDIAGLRGLLRRLRRVPAADGTGTDQGRGCAPSPKRD